MLPPKITDFNCSGNRLTCLPQLPPKLQYLYCCENQLTCLPRLPESITHLSYWSNPIYYICVNGHDNGGFYDHNHDISDVNDKNRIIHNFRFLYYSLRYKKRFRDLLWIKVREPRIMNHYSPANLVILLEGVDGQTEFDEKLSKW